MRIAYKDAKALIAEAQIARTRWDVEIVSIKDEQKIINDAKLDDDLYTYRIVIFTAEINDVKN